MARTKKKDTTAQAPTQVAPENTAPLREGEAHLDPAQFEDMDDATLQGLAQDMGLDPAAYDSRDALISAIAAVPVVPGPPEAEAEQPQGDPAPDLEAAPEEFTPYEATVAIPLAVIRRGKAPRPEDKPIGTLTMGDKVTVTAIQDGYAMLANGTYVKEAFLKQEK